MKRIILLAVLVAGAAAVVPAHAVADCVTQGATTVCYYADGNPSGASGYVYGYDSSGNALFAGTYAYQDPNYRYAGVYGFAYQNGSPVGASVTAYQDVVNNQLNHGEFVVAGSCWLSEAGWLYPSTSYGNYSTGC